MDVLLEKRSEIQNSFVMIWFDCGLGSYDLFIVKANEMIFIRANNRCLVWDN